MPPKKKIKTNNNSGLPTDSAAMPSNHGVISTDSNIHQEPFTIPDVKTMDKPTLKSELLHLEVLSYQVMGTWIYIVGFS